MAVPYCAIDPAQFPFSTVVATNSLGLVILTLHIHKQHSIIMGIGE